MTVKRSFDLAASALLLVCLAPTLLLIAVLVKLDGGPAIYGSRRLGRQGQVFECLKFRTMVADADRVLREALERDAELRAEWRANFKLRDDPRITRIGRFLRVTSLDELPQLVNVLRGEMSLVGPRPLLPDERAAYGAAALELYESVVPGITGLWQVSGRDEVEYERRIQLNTWYVENWSLWHDFVILARTVVVVFRRAGAS